MNCDCPAYPWPHRLGSGACDVRLDDDSAWQQTHHVARFLSRANGVALVETDDGFFAVGIYTKVGEPVLSRALYDFCITLDIVVARHYFSLKTGS